MKKIIILSITLLMFGNTLRAMHEEDTSAQKAATASKTAEKPKEIPKTERELNDDLVERGNPEAIGHKIYGLFEGGFGYEKNLQAAREFIDNLVERSDQAAINCKIEGLACGGDAYESCDPYHLGPIKRYYPTYGYEKDLKAAKELNDMLVERGDEKAITRKINGLTRGGDRYGRGESYRGYPRYSSRYPTYYYPTYGYEKNPKAAGEFEKFIKILPFLSKVLNKYTPLPKDLQTIILRYIHRSIK